MKITKFEIALLAICLAAVGQLFYIPADFNKVILAQALSRLLLDITYVMAIWAVYKKEY